MPPLQRVNLDRFREIVAGGAPVTEVLIPAALETYDEVFFLPVFGLAGWLLSGGVVYLILRLAGKQSRFDWILNVIGWGLLTVMPAERLLTGRPHERRALPNTAG